MGKKCKENGEKEGKNWWEMGNKREIIQGGNEKNDGKKIKKKKLKMG